MEGPSFPPQFGNIVWAGPNDPDASVSGLIHCVRLPEDISKPVPTVVMVHGWGGDESVMWIFSRAVPREAAIVTPRAPHKLDSGGYVWFAHDERATESRPDEFTEAVATLRHFVSSLPTLHPISHDRIVLIGFSQGAAVCQALTLSYPEITLGLASIAGASPVHSVPPSPEGPGSGNELGRYAPDLPRHNSLAGMPIFIAHGRDDDTVPIESARSSRENFTRKNAAVTYHEYESGHKLNAQGFRDLGAWLQEILTVR